MTRFATKRKLQLKTLHFVVELFRERKLAEEGYRLLFDHKDESGWTALHYAMVRGSDEATESLSMQVLRFNDICKMFPSLLDLACGQESILKPGAKVLAYPGSVTRHQAPGYFPICC